MLSEQVSSKIARSWPFAKIPGGYRAVSMVLAVAIVVMLAIWQPWLPNVKASDRTISVTGTATVTAVPDQYVFSPSYDFTNDNKQVALDKVTATSNKIVAQLKKIGVADKDIKTNVNGSYSYGYYLPIYKGGDTYTLYLTVTVDSASLAQKVQDYLVTTSPSGQVTPDVSFSTAKQKELQADARDKAERDARSQADQSAHNLGFTVAAVKSVVDGDLNSGSPIMYGSNLSAGADIAQPSKTSLAVQPGQNDLSYSVQVVYYIR